MAEKRMFTQKIIDSDAFLDMPTSAQALYFHLNMRADDDGFVNNPRKITRYVGANDDDLKLLLMKRFIIGFDSGVIVIKHWRMHNTLKMDRYKPTDYQEEFAQLTVKSNKAYTDRMPDGSADFDCGTSLEPEWNQNGNQLEPQIRVDKNRLDQNREDEAEVPAPSRKSSFDRITEAWNSLGLSTVTKIAPGTKRYNLLNKRLKDYGEAEVLRAVENVRNSPFLTGGGANGWTATFDWFIKPNNFVKVLDGNYLDRPKQTQPQAATNTKKYTTAENYKPPVSFTGTQDELMKHLHSLVDQI